MADLEEKLVEAVTTLIQLTQENRLKWHTASVPKHLINDDRNKVETVFLATHEKTNLRLYKRNDYIDPNPILSPLTKSYWSSSIVLEIIDGSGNLVWTFPKVSPLDDLLASVRYQVADVDEFISSLLTKSQAGKKQLSS